ncbi:hypothetical protein PsorP6_003074 [Peronosclerospora sorghi]|uniref:Uncharacterized protein n=1 Tax=Peronosclerospora sorghi TaxID=230839 RepID=A0ACC0VM21_9STRA|nr:hypothetical protein PsorP6_003074 [Peronosclerospora sorghi]
MAVRLNLEYLLGLSNFIFQFIPGGDEATILQHGLEEKNEMFVLNVLFPDDTVSAVFDSLQEDKGEGISSILGTTMGSILGGIAHVTPIFHFSEIVYQNRFFYEYDLIYDVVLQIVHSVIGQWYKIVGSVEMLGDPVGLATDVVNGFALAMRQLKRNVKGQSRRKVESAVTVVFQTVFGVPFKSIGKVSNGLGDVVKKATFLRVRKTRMNPDIFLKVLCRVAKFRKKYCVWCDGLVKEPVRGAKSGGVKGFAKGVGGGTFQLVAFPVVGALDGRKTF